jgi:hypothetical protein
MKAEIIRQEDLVRFSLYDFKSHMNNFQLNRFKRISAIDHDTLVPVIYAITGSNLISDYSIAGCYEHVYDCNDNRYKDCILCIDHRDVKKVREAFIKAMFKKQGEFIIRNVSYVLDQSNTIQIPNDFIAKKQMLANVQNGLSSMIKRSIEKDNEIGLMIVE